jgi:hypothetical protein
MHFCGRFDFAGLIDFDDLYPTPTCAEDSKYICSCQAILKSLKCGNLEVMEYEKLGQNVTFPMARG